MKVSQPMSRSLTLSEIRSQACNTTLVTFTIVAIPALIISLTRIFEQGWKPLMGVHITVFLLLATTTLLRHRLAFNLRAGFLVGMFFMLAVAGMLSYGLGTGAVMFFITGSIFAACFFSPTLGFIMIAVGTVLILLMYLARSTGLMPDAIDPRLYSKDITSWLGACASLVLCATGPILALTAVNRALEAERQRADAAANARSQFLARMSHELRTPMTGVIGMAELLEGTQLTPEQNKMTTRLLRAARNLLELLNDVLDFAKVEAGRIVIENTPFRISDVVSEITDLFTNAAADRRIIITTHLPATFTDHVTGDRFRLGQVLSNLVSNALKFTPHGSIGIDVSQTLQESGDTLTTFSVSDTGIGISPDELTRLFQPFVQADSSTTRKYGGSGLGLVISQSLVAAMGGDISVASTPGKGSTFTFTLPLHPDRVAIQATRLAAPATPKSTGKSLLTIPEGLRILLADDDPMVHTLIKLVLEDAAAQITSVDDGAKAIKAAAAGTFDMMLIDMHMPEVDGVAATRAIRAAEAAKADGTRIPIIALTADIVSDSKQQFLDAGANAVVAKPIAWPKLQEEINKLAKNA